MKEVVYKDEMFYIEKTKAKSYYDKWSGKTLRDPAEYKLYSFIFNEGIALVERDEDGLRFSKKLIRNMLESARSYLAGERIRSQSMITIQGYNIKKFDEMTAYIKQLEERN